MTGSAGVAEDDDDFGYLIAIQVREFNARFGRLTAYGIHETLPIGRNAQAQLVEDLLLLEDSQATRATAKEKRSTTRFRLGAGRTQSTRQEGYMCQCADPRLHHFVLVVFFLKRSSTCLVTSFASASAEGAGVPATAPGSGTAGMLVLRSVKLRL